MPVPAIINFKPKHKMKSNKYEYTPKPISIHIVMEEKNEKICYWQINEWLATQLFPSKPIQSRFSPLVQYVEWFEYNSNKNSQNDGNDASITRHRIFSYFA